MLLGFSLFRFGRTFVTGPNGDVLARNPLNDLRVRQALSLAINRQAIVDRVMEGAAIPTGQYLRPGSYSYVQDLPPTPYEPERAKALLAEAGFPKGLRVTIHGPNDRYVNDAKIIQAVAQMWQRIGVQTTVDAMPWNTFIARAGKQEFSIFLLGWGVGSGEGLNPLRAQLATWNPSRGLGTANRGRYSNPAVDAGAVADVADAAQGHCRGASCDPPGGGGRDGPGADRLRRRHADPGRGDPDDRAERRQFARGDRKRALPR